MQFENYLENQLLEKLNKFTYVINDIEVGGKKALIGWLNADAKVPNISGYSNEPKEKGTKAHKIMGSAMYGFFDGLFHGALSDGINFVKNGGIAICAPIAPYQKTRDDVREEIEAFGSFIEVYLSTPLEICEKRDRKGLYKLAREGKIKEFTGISDPYEIPKNPELILNSEDKNVEYCASLIILKLKSLGLIFG